MLSQAEADEGRSSMAAGNRRLVEVGDTHERALQRTANLVRKLLAPSHRDVNETSAEVTQAAQPIVFQFST